MPGIVAIGGGRNPSKEIWRNNAARHPVDSEAYVIVDEDGHVQYTDDPDILWDNPDIYEWIGSDMVGNIMVYYFEFTG